MLYTCFMIWVYFLFRFLEIENHLSSCLNLFFKSPNGLFQIFYHCRWYITIKANDKVYHILESEHLTQFPISAATIKYGGRALLFYAGTSCSLCASQSDEKLLGEWGYGGWRQNRHTVASQIWPLKKNTFEFLRVKHDVTLIILKTSAAEGPTTAVLVVHRKSVDNRYRQFKKRHWPIIDIPLRKQ